MKTIVRTGLVMGALCLGFGATAQRYLNEVFTNAQISITSDVIYGTNIDFLTSNFGSPMVPSDVVTLQTAVSTNQPIPAAYFDPSNTSTAVKVTNLRMDVYQPNQAIDTETARPLVIYVHTGNALPPPINGSPTGRRTDSTAVEMCKSMARRGYVAASMSYRLGWNPLAGTEQERRGQLLNAIYRAVHDLRQCVRTMKKDAAQGVNQYNICADRIIVIGEGTGGYIAVANATLNRPAELYLEKFRPDPFNPAVSYIDSTNVGNLAGFNGNLTLYRPNGFDHRTQFCVNMGGALADESWLEPGDVPMVSFHTIFDPFAPFTEGIVIVPTTGGPVVPVHGSNFFIDRANEYGNNDVFANLPSDPYTDAARAMYGTTQTHGSNSETISTGAEGLFPLLRPYLTTPLLEEASPWQFWDPNHPLALAVVSAGPPPVTAHQASSRSNPDMSPEKARIYIDTIMGYTNPRIHAALLAAGGCTFTAVDENATVDHGVEVYPNPARSFVTFSSTEAPILSYEVFDVNGRLVRTASVNGTRAVMEREGLQAGIYTVSLRFADGKVNRTVMLD